jgi:hypothetical protein
VIDESDLQDEKYFDPKISTLFGIAIDGSDEYENVSDSIRVKFELDSNAIGESHLLSKTHCDPSLCLYLTQYFGQEEEDEYRNSSKPPGQRYHFGSDYHLF